MNHRHLMEQAFQEALKLQSSAKSILEEYEGKEMPQEKENEIDALFDRAEAKVAEGQRYQRAEHVESTLNQPTNRLPGTISTVEQDDSAVKMAIFRKALNYGPNRLTLDELKAMSVTDETEGGYLVAPEQMAAGIIQKLDDMVYIRRYADTQQVMDASSLGLVTIDDDDTDADWTAELSDADMSAIVTTGKRALTPYRISKGAIISRRLIRKARSNVENIVQSRLAFKFAKAQETAFMLGDGDKKPLGLFTPSKQGIDTDRDVTAAGSTALEGDDFLDAKYAMKPQYLQNARWILHRDVVKALRKLKLGTGEYVWERGLSNDRPDTLLELPYLMSEYAPKSITSGNYVALLGDLSFYMIADSLQMSIQVLIEKYALADANGYLANMETDGMPILSEAFVRLKMA